MINYFILKFRSLFVKKPLDNTLYYGFESEYLPYADYLIGAPPKVDLLLMDLVSKRILTGFEIKLTTLPDESTAHLTDDKYGSELVIRMPSIEFLACSIADIYKDEYRKLSSFFGKNGFGSISSYMEAAQVNPRIGDIWNIMNGIIIDNVHNQKPAIIQPIWKTKGKSFTLADNCLDIFVWSDLAFTKLFMKEARNSPADQTKAVDRPTRALIQLFFMLNDVSVKGKFHKNEIQQKLSYTMKNDKAFSVPGRKTWAFMNCRELTNPRINKSEIKNIILGGGQNFLSPERRFDATLVSSIDLFS
jgi:hypothetical protein